MCTLKQGKINGLGRRRCDLFQQRAKMCAQIKCWRICQHPNFFAKPDSPIAAIGCNKTFMDQCTHDALYRRAGQFDFACDLPKAQSAGMCTQGAQDISRS